MTKNITPPAPKDKAGAKLSYAERVRAALAAPYKKSPVDKKPKDK